MTPAVAGLELIAGWWTGGTGYGVYRFDPLTLALSLRERGLFFVCDGWG